MCRSCKISLNILAIAYMVLVNLYSITMALASTEFSKKQGFSKFWQSGSVGYTTLPMPHSTLGVQCLFALAVCRVIRCIFPLTYMPLPDSPPISIILLFTNRYFLFFMSKLDYMHVFWVRVCILLVPYTDIHTQNISYFQDFLRFSK